MDSHPAASTESSEIVFVLFSDLVAFSELSINQQRKVKSQLQDIARNTPACQLAELKNAIIYRPTGDGLALVFFGDPEAPAHCAVEMSRTLKHHPGLPLRMGMHMGPILRDTDITKQPDVVGGGINKAQRVMDLGDAGHILLSREIADILLELDGWKPFLHDLGEVTVKHGRKVHLYNFYNDEVGNHNAPAKLRFSSASMNAAASSEGGFSNSGLARDAKSDQQPGPSEAPFRESVKRQPSRLSDCPQCGMLLPSGGGSCSHCGW